MWGRNNFILKNLFDKGDKKAEAIKTNSSTSSKEWNDLIYEANPMVKILAVD